VFVLPSKVFLTDLQANAKQSVLQKVSDLFELLQPHEVFGRKDLVAVKIHFGEEGNTGYIRPQYVRRVVDRLLQIGAKPFLTDTNSLYVGTRAEACSHLGTAFDNGFTREITRAPVIIADGLRGNSGVEVLIAGRYVKNARIASDIRNADGMVVLSHFKGHELAGFGGALKNLGMGCAAREGKLEQHSNISPRVTRRKCVGCGECITWCRGEAITLVGEGQEARAMINPERCVGCAECILSCRQGAIQVQWNESIPVFMEKMVEYAAAAVSNKRDKTLFLTFVTDVSPLCDCYPFSDRAIVPDLAILASTDPVAIDQAAVDQVNGAPANPVSSLKETLSPGDDKFRAIYPHIDWTHQLDYASKIGLGTREYELVWL
jgi:uncharacterized Fe-S center protein